MKAFKIYEIAPSNWINSGFMQTLCGVANDLCKFADHFVSDLDPELNSDVAAKAYFSHYPSGSSLKEIVHLNQISRA